PRLRRSSGSPWSDRFTRPGGQVSRPPPPPEDRATGTEEETTGDPGRPPAAAGRPTGGPNRDLTAFWTSLRLRHVQRSKNRGGRGRHGRRGGDRDGGNRPLRRRSCFRLGRRCWRRCRGPPVLPGVRVDYQRGLLDSLEGAGRDP